MEIEVGEWVRTDKGLISKVIEIRLAKHREKDIVQDVYILEKGEWTAKQYIVSHSENIIDLIEVGDYVNGYYVERVWEQVNYRMAIDLRGSYLGLSDDKFIKSIVTKEQFSSVEYLLEEK